MRERAGGGPGTEGRMVQGGTEFQKVEENFASFQFQMLKTDGYSKRSIKSSVKSTSRAFTRTVMDSDREEVHEQRSQKHQNISKKEIFGWSP